MAKTQLAWCQREMVKASREMGYGDDWHKAMEAVKNSYVEPGKQPDLIRALALEGEKFAEDRNLVTVSPLAKETWRMEMMSPERQFVNPFFLGGETIIVSYPTDTMTYDQRMMSMRGNNPGFSHATAFHELIPGHWLQQFMTARYRPYRQPFGSGFWVEGNAFYWEMLYWDLGFDATPEQRIGALFWRILAQLPPGHHDNATSDRLPRRRSGPRARQRHGRGAPLRQWRLRPALPVRLHARRVAVPCPAP
jgi:hypothetical protein